MGKKGEKAFLSSPSLFLHALSDRKWKLEKAFWQWVDFLCCVVPEIIPTFPTEGNFFLRPPITPLAISLNLMH